jgi:hypothetical protein
LTNLTLAGCALHVAFRFIITCAPYVLCVSEIQQFVSRVWCQFNCFYYVYTTHKSWILLSNEPYDRIMNSNFAVFIELTNDEQINHAQLVFGCIKSIADDNDGTTATFPLLVHGTLVTSPLLVHGTLVTSSQVHIRVPDGIAQWGVILCIPFAATSILYN